MQAGSSSLRALLGGSSRFAERSACAERSRVGWTTTSYGELSNRIARVSAGARATGIGARDRVALLGDASSAWIAGFLALHDLGAVPVLLDTKSTAAGLQRARQHVEARSVLVCDALAASRAVEAGFQDVLDVSELERRAEGKPPQPHAWQPDDCALIAMTSGTTGEPRGVRLPWRSLLHQVESLGRALEVRDSDVFVSILPPAHMLGLVCGILTPLSRGSEVAFAPSVLPDEVLAIVRERRATRMLVVPMFLALLAKTLRDRTLREIAGEQLRAIHCGGAALDSSLALALERGGIDVLVGYGMTEAGPVIATNTRGAKRAGSVGRTLDGVELRIDDGEILARGPNVMLGYLGDECAPSQSGDGWLATGDLGHVDADGFVFITGRRKELIVLASGCKVRPEHVERVLGSSPLVREVCVLGRAADANERVEAVVVPSDAALSASSGNSERLEAALRAAIVQVQRDLASFERPERVHVAREPLPRSASGKVMRREVARWLDERGGGA
jgi:long-chain acyl-CoA synthetase